MRDTLAIKVKKKQFFFGINAHQYLVPSLFLIQSQCKEKFTELVIESFTAITRYHYG